MSRQILRVKLSKEHILNGGTTVTDHYATITYEGTQDKIPNSAWCRFDEDKENRILYGVVKRTYRIDSKESI